MPCDTCTEILAIAQEFKRLADEWREIARERTEDLKDAIRVGEELSEIAKQILDRPRF